MISERDFFAPELERGQSTAKDELVDKLKCQGNLLPVYVFEVLRSIWQVLMTILYDHNALVVSRTEAG